MFGFPEGDRQLDRRQVIWVGLTKADNLTRSDIIHVHSDNVAITSIFFWASFARRGASSGLSGSLPFLEVWALHTVLGLSVCTGSQEARRGF
jgi:hypothetical protein